MADFNNKTIKKNDFYIDPRRIVVKEGFNARSNFDLEDLKESIRQNGVLQNLTVFKLEDEEEEKYQLVDGERRYRSVMELIEEGLEIPRVPVNLIPKLSEADLLQQQVTRNEEQKSFNEYEYAIVCQKYLNFGFTKSEIAKKLNRNSGVITYYLQHFQRDERVQELLKKGRISGSEVRRIYSAYDKEEDAVKEILKTIDKANKEKKKTITVADLDINSRVRSKKVSNSIRIGLEKLVNVFEKYSKDDNGNELDLNFNILQVLDKLKNGYTIDEIFIELKTEALALKKAI